MSDIVKSSSSSIPQPSAAEIAELMAESFAPDESLGVTDLPRIRVPAGGGQNWELPDGSAARQFDAIIVHRQITRSYWSSQYSGENTPPDCSSEDGVIGVGTPGGECAKCPLSQFGSDGKNGQACKRINRLFLLFDGGIMPVVLNVPPSSGKYVLQYLVSLATSGIGYWQVKTRFTLAKAKSSTGIEYSIVQFQRAGELSAIDAENVEVMRRQLIPVIIGRTVAAK